MDSWAIVHFTNLFSLAMSRKFSHILAIWTVYLCNIFCSKLFHLRFYYYFHEFSEIYRKCIFTLGSGTKSQNLNLQIQKKLE